MIMQFLFAPVWLGPIDIRYKGVAFLFGEKKLFVDITDSNRIVKKMCRFLALSFRALTV